MLNKFIPPNEDIPNKLSGRISTLQERLYLESNFPNSPTLNILIEIIGEVRIINQIFSIEEQNDQSGFGVEMQWMSPLNQVKEANETYPGIVINKYDYIPIGLCLSGSGDSYYLKMDDGTPKIFRMPHDGVQNGTYYYRHAEFVLNLEDLFNYVV
jgi:hypothetical protein